MVDLGVILRRFEAPDETRHLEHGVFHCRGQTERAVRFRGEVERADHVITAFHALQGNDRVCYEARYVSRAA